MACEYCKKNWAEGEYAGTGGQETCYGCYSIAMMAYDVAEEKLPAKQMAMAYASNKRAIVNLRFKAGWKELEDVVEE